MNGKNGGYDPTQFAAAGRSRAKTPTRTAGVTPSTRPIPSGSIWPTGFTPCSTGPRSDGPG